MKEKLHYFVEAVLAVAVIVLFVFQFSGEKKASIDSVVQTEGDATPENVVRLAYIDVDSLLRNYSYSIDMNEQIVKKFESFQANISDRYRKLEVEANDYKRKYETGYFLTQQSAESEQMRIMKLEEDINIYREEKSKELSEEQARMNQELSKTVVSQLRDYNKDKGYSIIYGKLGENILYADDAYNITTEVVEYFNKRRASNSSE